MTLWTSRHCFRPLFICGNKVWSFSEIENLNEGEVDTLFAEIPSDGESVDEFGESDDEKNAATNMEHKKRS
ncbi:hypothetical protein QE152_g9617 [Popillia japonica]|uniref:Uncharacterized protein n=1 Tax=Popillia japonica TaxID=7064 RepID=A0AAW1LXM6_POPJA